MTHLHFPSSRWAAAAVHICFSAILLLIVFSLVYFIWYPGAITFAGGAQNGLEIVIAVDMVLGPLLTLVVYNITKAKKVLIRDLAFIAILQIICLLAGLSLVYEQRPLAIVYNNQGFQIFDAQKLRSKNIQVNLLDKFTGSYPKIILEETSGDSEGLTKYQLKKNPFLEKGSNHELWVSFPKDVDTLKTLFPENNLSNCINKKIKSFHSKGSICFDAKTRSFSHFQALK